MKNDELNKRWSGSSLVSVSLLSLLAAAGAGERR